MREIACLDIEFSVAANFWMTFSFLVRGDERGGGRICHRKLEKREVTWFRDFPRHAYVILAISSFSWASGSGRKTNDSGIVSIRFPNLQTMFFVFHRMAVLELGTNVVELRFLETRVCLSVLPDWD